MSDAMVESSTTAVDSIVQPEAIPECMQKFRQTFTSRDLFNFTPVNKSVTLYLLSEIKRSLGVKYT